jgi:hypothetical protein
MAARSLLLYALLLLALATAAPSHGLTQGRFLAVVTETRFQVLIISSRAPSSAGIFGGLHRRPDFACTHEGIRLLFFFFFWLRLD